jgi:hypothetical protein
MALQPNILNSHTINPVALDTPQGLSICGRVVSFNGVTIMENWRVIAVLDKSAGNETVGEMWQETKSFDCNTPVIEIMRWAVENQHSVNNPEDFKKNLKLTVDQPDKKEAPIPL